MPVGLKDLSQIHSVRFKIAKDSKFSALREANYEKPFRKI